MCTGRRVDVSWMADVGVILEVVRERKKIEHVLDEVGLGMCLW